MARRYAVGDRVDGLYDGNSDDVWYPGFITAVRDDGAAFDVLYDDGEAEHNVAAKFLRVHALGTLCAGSRVYGRYAGGDEWYAGKIQELQDDGSFTIEYDDGEVEASVPMAFIRESLVVAAEDDTADEALSEQEPETIEQEDVPAAIENALVDDRPATAVENASQEEADTEETHPAAAENASNEGSFVEEAAPEEAAPVPSPPREHANLGEDLAQPSQSDRRKPKVGSSPPSDEQPSTAASALAFADANGGVVDEYANIMATMERLETCSGDAVATKTLLSTLVKQMRAFPQATADLVHSRGGEGLLMDILKQHHTHAVIQCYGFVLLRRLCFLCGKSTHFFLRNGIVDLVTIAMRKFLEDAILQASACGALAVFTRVHAGLAALLENRVSHLVLATIIFHKSYSVHTRQVHYYACEVLLELCELGDKTTIEALCGDGISGPGLSDLSPVSLLLFLLRQALSFEDKKACCAAGTLLMCLASCHRHAAQMVLDLSGLSELSTVMAKFPMEPGIQKYAASASREIAMCSMDQSSPHKRVQHAAHTVLGESSSMEDLRNQRLSQQRKAGGKASGNAKSSSGKRKPPHSQRSGVSSMNGFPSPTHHQQIGAVTANARDALSFSKYTSPIGKAPHLPPNIRPFGDAGGAPSPSAAAYHQQLQQRNQLGSPLVILDTHGAMTSDKKRLVKDERTNLLFETYGVDAKSAMHSTHPNDHSVRTHGIKRRQLKTHIVSASAASEGISWASPVKPVMLQDAKPLSSRSEKRAVKGSIGEARKVRSSGGEVGAGLGTDDEQQSPATLRRQQAHATTKAIKKQDGDVKTPRSSSFHLKLENAQAATSSAGLASPIVVSPKTNRQGASSSRSKTTTKPSNNRPAPRTKVASRDNGMGSNTSTESLNSYAVQLFKDEIEASAKSSSEARDAAQERERLSFAEKLHKMIDKAKSSLAQSSTVSLASEAYNSPMKTTTRPEPVQSASTKKKQPPPAVAATSRVAPASLKSSAPVGEAAATASTPDTTVAKKPPAAAPKSAPVKKPVAAPVPTPAIASKPVAPSKGTKPHAATPARSAAIPMSTPMRASAPAPSSKPASKPASTVKPAASAKAVKPSQVGAVAAVAAATAAVVSVAASMAAGKSSDNTVSGGSVAPDDASSSQAIDDETKEQPTAIAVEGASVETSKVADEVVDSAPADASEPNQTTASAESVPSTDSTPDAREVAASEATEEPTTVEQTATAPSDAAASETNAVEAAVKEAAVVASSAADDLYADEYNDFDDLDNGPHTLDDDGADAGAEMDNGVSFEALMSLTAQVTEFSVATEAVIKVDAPVVETAEAPASNVPEPISVPQGEASVDVPATSVTAVEAAATSNEQPDETNQADVEAPEEADQNLETPLPSNETTFVAQAEPSVVVQESDAEATQVVAVASVDEQEPSVVPAEEQGGVTSECSEEQLEQRHQDGVSDDQPSSKPVDEITADTDAQEDQRAPTPGETDRPESRQTDVSYADEDFDDATENAEGDAIVDKAQDDEATTGENPAIDAPFTVATPLLEPENEVGVAQEQESTEHVEVPLVSEPEPSVGEPLVEETQPDTQAELSQDNEDDYGDADFAGDESVPAGEELAEAHDSAPTHGSAEVADGASTLESEADAVPTRGEVEDGSQTSVSEDTVPTAHTEPDQQLGVGDDDADTVPAFESNDALAAEESPPEPSAETSSSITHVGDGDDVGPVNEQQTINKPAYVATVEEPVETTSDALQSDAEEALPPAPAGERTTTPDVYDDADFAEDGEVRVKNSDEAVVATEVNAEEAPQEPISTSDQQPEPSADPTRDPSQQQGVMPDELAVSEVDRQATPDVYADDAYADDGYADDSAFDDESTPPPVSGVADVDSPQPEVETPVVVEIVPELGGNAAADGVSPAQDSDPLTTEGAVDYADQEKMLEASDESAVGVSDNAKLEADSQSSAHDRIPPSTDEVAEVGGGDQARGTVIGESIMPIETRGDEDVAKPEPIDASVAPESEAHAEEAAAAVDSVPSPDDLPAHSNDESGILGATSTDGDQELPPAVQEDTSSAEQHDEDVPSSTTNSRPATAATYDDDGFDGETPRAGETPSLEIEVNEPDPAEQSRPERDSGEDTVEMPAAQEEGTSLTLAQSGEVRPTTADAYADDAEFDDEVAAEEPHSIDEVAVGVTEADTTSPQEDVVLATEGEGEKEQASESPLESPADDDEALMRDVDDLLGTPSDEPVATEGVTQTADQGVPLENSDTPDAVEEATPGSSKDVDDEQVLESAIPKESALHESPAKLPQEPVESAAPEPTTTLDVDETKPGPEEQVAVTARSDPDDAYGADDFDDAPGEVTAGEPHNSPEEHEPPVSDAPVVDEATDANPPNETTEPVEDAAGEVASLAEDAQNTRSDELDGEAEPSSSAVEEPAEQQADQAPDILEGEETVVKADVTVEEGATLDVPDASESVKPTDDAAQSDLAETASPEVVDRDTVSPTDEADADSSEPLAELHEEQTAVEPSTLTSSEADPVPSVADVGELSASASESSAGAIEDTNVADVSPESTAELEQLSNGDMSELPTQHEEKKQAAVDTHAKEAASELELKSTIATAVENESVDLAKTVEAVEAVESAEAVENVQTVERVQAAADVEAVEALEAAEAMEVVAPVVEKADAESPELTVTAIDDSAATPTDEDTTNEPSAVETPAQAQVEVTVVDEPVEPETAAADEGEIVPPEVAAEPTDVDAATFPDDAVHLEEVPEEPAPLSTGAKATVEPAGSTASEEPRAELVVDASGRDEATTDAAAVDAVPAGDTSEPAQEYAFGDEAPSPEQATVDPVAVVEPVVVSAPAQAEDDEPLYKDDENEFEEDSPRVEPLQPQTTEPAAAAPSPVESVPSPATDDAEYDDFEAEETTTPRVPAAATAPPAGVPKLAKQPTKDEIDDETAYDDENAYNEFEEDESPQAKKPAAPAAAAADDVDDAYDMEETFDEDDKALKLIAAAPPAAVATTSSPATAPEDGDYEAEYDEFED